MIYHHICVTYLDTRKAASSGKRPVSDYEVKLDLSAEWLNERIISCYDMGTGIVLNGKAIPIADIERIQISRADQSSEAYREDAYSIWYNEQEGGMYGDSPQKKWIDKNIVEMGEDVTDDLILGHPGWKSSTDYPYGVVPKPSELSTAIFVVHGRDTQARDDIFQFLRAIGLHPIEWSEAIQLTGKSSPYIWEILERAFSEAHAILVLFTPDDEAHLRASLRSEGDPTHETKLSGQARPNVLFEAGMAMGRSEDRTVLVELGILRPFSDIAGRHTIKLDNSSRRRQELAQRLQLAGCPVNLEGTDWHTVGNFEPSS